MTSKEFLFRVRNRLRNNLVQFIRNTRLYPMIYSSYWHYLFHSRNTEAAGDCYYAAIPNPGARIGHQIANWIAGYWYAGQFGLKFAHVPFPNEKWENFLSFGDGERNVEELVRNDYRKIRLPLFKESDAKEIDLNKRIIRSYKNKKVVFVAEQDQFYRDQHNVISDLKKKFFSADARKNDRLIYSDRNFNIAVHVRRGDIVQGIKKINSNLLMRWQDNSYFLNVLRSVIRGLKQDKPVAIYLFSQGEREDFIDFQEFESITLCLDMSPQDSFLHMVYSDLLITSKSSFSYKPALLNNGIKVCPENFWHGYPEAKDWILADADGIFDINRL